MLIILAEVYPVPVVIPDGLPLIAVPAAKICLSKPSNLLRLAAPEVVSPCQYALPKAS